jgi:hypothetical protein
MVEGELIATHRCGHAALAHLLSASARRVSLRGVEDARNAGAVLPEAIAVARGSHALVGPGIDDQ